MRLVVPTSAQVASEINGPPPCSPVIQDNSLSWSGFGTLFSVLCRPILQDACGVHMWSVSGTSYFKAIALPLEQLCRNCKPWASGQPVCTILPSIGQGSQVRPQASDLQIHAKVACKIAGCPASPGPCDLVWATALFASDKISVNRLPWTRPRVRMQACRRRAWVSGPLMRTLRREGASSAETFSASYPHFQEHSPVHGHARQGAHGTCI